MDQTLHQALCTVECASCGAFGGYLYLLTCTRVCILCFTDITENHSYRPLPSRHLLRHFAQARPLLNTLPQVLSRPGKYSADHINCHERVDLVDGQSAWEASVALHGPVAAMHQRAIEDTWAQWTAESSTISPARRPQSPDTSFDYGEGDPLRFMAVVRAPWLDQSSQSVEWGGYCRACYHMYQGSPPFWRMFTVASFDAHLRQHGAVKLGEDGIYCH